MGRATSPLQLHGQVDAVSPTLLAGAGEGYLVARVLDHDWGERLGEVAIEESFDGGRTWPVALTTAHGVRPDEHGEIWADYAPGVALGLRFIRARARVAGTLTATIEIEALPVEFPPYVEPHHSVAFVQSVRAGSAGASQQDVTLATPVANNLLLAHGSINNASMTVTSCNQNPTGTPVAFTALQATQTGGGANTLRDRVFWLAACTTNTTVRVVFSGSSACALVVHEYSGHNPTGPIHAYAVAVGSSTAPNSGNITTTQANCMLVGFAKTPNTAVTWTPGGSFTIRQPPSGSQREASSDRSVSAAGTYAASYTTGTTDDWHCWIIAIQEPVDPLWANLAAYWKLDEAATGTRYDNFSGLCNLTDTNTVGANTGVISNCAQVVQANSEYLSCLDSEFIRGGDTDWTFNFWLRMDTTQTGYSTIIGKDDGTGSVGDFTMWWDLGGKYFHWIVYNGARGVIGEVLGPVGEMTNGVWYMFTIDHSATTNTVGIRRNGGTRASSATSGAAGSSTRAFRLSGDYGTGWYWDGCLDEVGFWKRSLTDAEATQLYNAGAGLSFPNAPAAAGGIPFFMQEDLMSGGTQRQSGGKQ